MTESINTHPTSGGVNPYTRHLPPHRETNLVEALNPLLFESASNTLPRSSKRSIRLQPRLNRIKRMTNKTLRRPTYRPRKKTRR